MFSLCNFRHIPYNFGVLTKLIPGHGGIVGRRWPQSRFGVEISEIDSILQLGFDAAETRGDLAGDGSSLVEVIDAVGVQQRKRVA